MRIVLPILALTGALIASPAAAHDAPLAFVEAMEAHLLDCPAINGLGPNGDMLRDGWVTRAEVDPVLTARAEAFFARERIVQSTVNIYTKTVAGFELIQFMAARTLAKDDVELASALEDPANIQSTDYLCVTMVPELPFMPSGKLLQAIFGEEVDVGIANTPGDTLDGSWIWDDLSPTHKRTIARYTNENAASQGDPSKTFYPGFYILSLRQFTAENPE